MLLLGIDLGTSSIKVSIVDAQTGTAIASASYPENEVSIISPRPGWAEQSPETWWEHTQQAIRKVHAGKKYNPSDISAIGVAYQMHGLVIVDKDQNVLRNSIIWCDSRAVELGEKAFAAIGERNCLDSLLNSPGNFTASKLAWVKHNEPDIYKRIDKAMLPGDLIAMKMTGSINTSVPALSEGIFWDFKQNQLSDDVMSHYGIDPTLIPPIHPLFSVHGELSGEVASALYLKKGIPVTYKAGDQPNNALSLNVFEPGEVAATAGTSGVVYGVSDKLTYDPQSRVNTFAHVNHTAENPRLGVLLCINGTGSLNRWVKERFANGKGYEHINKEAAGIAAGSDGLSILPFGNGAERMLINRMPGAQFRGIDFNIHRSAHVFRAAQEGIAFAFRYGLDIMRENKMNLSVIRAGRANLFLSELFTRIFVDTTRVPVELYGCDGSVGAAIGAGLGSGVYKSPKEAFQNFKPQMKVEPGELTDRYGELYAEWSGVLEKELQMTNYK